MGCWDQGDGDVPRSLSFSAVPASCLRIPPPSHLCAPKRESSGGSLTLLFPTTAKEMLWRSSHQALPGGSGGKESACKAGDLGSIPGFDPWVGKIPWRRKWQLTPVFLPRKPHGQRNLVGYRPWGCKESDMTERLYLFAY